MPPKGFRVLTLPEDLVNALTTEATNKNVTIPKLLSDLLSASKNTPSEKPLESAEPHFSVEVSERALRILTYASKAYNKPIPVIIEKLIDAPLNVIPPDINT